MQIPVLMSVIYSTTAMELSIINLFDAKLHRIPKGDVAKAPYDPTNPISDVQLFDYILKRFFIIKTRTIRHQNKKTVQS